MNFEDLVPFIKRALENNGVSTEEIQQVLSEQQNDSTQDSQSETLDNEMVDKQDQLPSEEENLEGKMLESTFKELEVEDAIEIAKERKSYDSSPVLDNNKDSSIKIGSYWDLLAHVRNNNRETTS
jgi:DNA-binding transcriptional MerR regulator